MSSQKSPRGVLQRHKSSSSGEGMESAKHPALTPTPSSGSQFTQSVPNSPKSSISARISAFALGKKTAKSTSMNDVSQASCDTSSDQLNAASTVNNNHALYYACVQGDFTTCEKLLMMSADVNYMTRTGFTPLHKAVEHGFLEIVRLLLFHDANINAASIDGLTPLSIAATHGQADIFKLLLTKNADSSIADKFKYNALHHAARLGHVKIVEILATSTSTSLLYARSIDGYTPLHWAVIHNHIDCVEVLVNFGGLELVNMVSDSIRSGDTPRTGVSSGVVASSGCTVFHLAAEYGHYEAFFKCASIPGAQLWLKDEDGQTPLHIAALNDHTRAESSKKRGRCDIVKYYIDAVKQKEAVARDSPVFFDNLKNTPLHCAATSGCKTCVGYMYKTLCPDVKKVREDLLPQERRSDLNINKTIREQPHGSAHTPGTTRLSGLQGKLNTNTLFHAWDLSNDEGMHPLHQACKYGRLDCVKLLLEFGVDLTLKNKEDETSLYCAVVCGHRNCIEPLVICGASFSEMSQHKTLRFEEDYDGENIRIDAGTLEELVEHLAGSQAIEDDFLKSFFVTYKCFTNANELMGLLTKQFLNAKNSASHDKITRVIMYWLQNHSRDFRSDSDLKQSTKRFLQEVCASPLPGTVSLGRRMTTVFDSKTVEGLPETKRKRGEISTCGVPVEDDGTKFMNSKSEKLAQQFCLIEFDIYYSIKKEELFHAAWNHAQKSHKSPNVLVFIERFEKASSWFRGIILKADKLNLRVKMLRKCLKVAHRCFNYHNFTTVMQIMSALEGAAISRLKKTWDKLSEKEISRYHHMRALLSSEKNYKLYREIIEKTEPPCVPFIGTFLTDLTFIDEGNKDYIETNSVTLINFKKFQMIAQLILNLQRFQKVGYSPAFQVDLPLNQYLLNATVAGDQKQAFDISLKLEPRTM